MSKALRAAGPALICLIALAAPAQPTPIVAIKAGRLIDPESGTASANQVVLVEAGKIKAVGANLAIPAGAEVVDLSSATVLPGIFDCHTHMCFTLGSVRGDGFPNLLRSILLGTVADSNGYRAIVGVANAREMLEAGFTTIRDVGNAGNYADSDLRRAIEEGLVPGPTIVNAGRIIVPYGGQFPGALNPDRRDLGIPEYLFADTRDELKKAVRENILYGAKVIKLVVDDQPFIYSADDIRFVVEEAGKAGLKVAAHCFTPAGAHNAAEGGVASIEHGQFMTDEDLALAKRKGIVLVGTDFSSLVEKQMRAPEVPLHAASVDRLKRAMKIGVTMAFGSDVITSAPGETRGSIALSNLDTYVEAGVPPKIVLQMLTTNAARLLGVEKERGAIRAGMAADIIAAPANPLEDVTALKKVSFVMKDGRIVRRPR